jgi:D-lactate dehydrogenase (cytochrome)
MATNAAEATSILGALRTICGANNVISDPDELRYFSMDLMWSGEIATAVAKPDNVEQVKEIVKLAAAEGYDLIPRGGGISYTKGYVPARSRCITLDLTGLNRIVEINEDDMYITVEAGCTWKQVYEALSEKGLRTPYFGPVSGVHATVGGALSQGSMFFGSGTYGPVAESVLSVRVVLGDGRDMVTGARANRGNVPFNRYFGPDLTGVFLSDTGAMGIKAEVSIRLIKNPPATTYASYGFDTFEQLYTAQAEIARHRIVAECFALDPFLGGKRTNLKSWTDGVKTLANVARHSGIADAVKVAKAGTKVLKEANFSMHVTIDGYDDDDAERKLAIVDGIALGYGNRLESSIPKILRAQPFQHVGDYLLGEGGLRWIPIHANLPISKVPEAYRRTMQYMSEHAEKLGELGIRSGFSTSIAGTDMIFEPQFFWPDEITDFHRRYLSKQRLAETDNNPADHAARAAVEQAMRDLTDIYMELGAVHQQIGRFYRYTDALDPVNVDVLRALKAALDPHGIVNPGSLGL